MIRDPPVIVIKYYFLKRVISGAISFNDKWLENFCTKITKRKGNRYELYFSLKILNPITFLRRAKNVRSLSSYEWYAKRNIKHTHPVICSTVIVTTSNKSLILSTLIAVAPLISLKITDDLMLLEADKKKRTIKIRREDERNWIRENMLPIESTCTAGTHFHSLVIGDRPSISCVCVWTNRDTWNFFYYADIEPRGDDSMTDDLMGRHDIDETISHLTYI